LLSVVPISDNGTNGGNAISNDKLMEEDAGSVHRSTVPWTVRDLTPTEFEAVPKYLRGRLILERVNQLARQLTSLFDDKYALLQRVQRNVPMTLTAEQRQRLSTWRDEEHALLNDHDQHGTGTCWFVTDGDLRAASVKLDPATRTMLSILRHLGRLRELRTPGIVRYVLL
jgi:hypothetical protein